MIFISGTIKLLLICVMGFLYFINVERMMRNINNVINSSSELHLKVATVIGSIFILTVVALLMAHFFIVVRQSMIANKVWF